MIDRTSCGDLQVATELYKFINDEAIPGTGLDPQTFWSGVDTLIHELAPINCKLLAKRDSLQAKIDAYHTERKGEPHNAQEYKTFLKEIGYLLPEPQNVKVTTNRVDAEVATTAGPQLVVPVMNARYALNAANARWGSLYNALYGTDAIPGDGGAEAGSLYNPIRGERVIAFAKQFLDDSAPLSKGSHDEAVGYQIVDGALVVAIKSGEVELADPKQLIGYLGDSSNPTAILIGHNGLHFEIQIDASHEIGKADKAGIKDILMESALTTIMDCEDSVAAVDAEDKVLVYRNW
ncbi:MAG: malate synthase G, partial [Rhodospirillales bacterium]